MQSIIDFLIKAKRNTYANGKALKTNSSRLGSKDYHYEEVVDKQSMCYHDTYFGGERFIGEEVVYVENKPIWAMNYNGYPLVKNLSEEIIDNILRPALTEVGVDKNVLPIRGPSKYKISEYTYTFENTGTIENFTGLERIYKNDALVYELHCSGGIIE